MAKAKGSPKSGGRRPGSVNKTTKIIQRFIGSTGVLCEKRIIQILSDQMPCSTCKGTGATKFQPRDINSPPGERTCQSCWGSKLEKLSPELIAKVAMEERNYVLPKKKAVEHTNPDGSLRPSWVVVLKDEK